MSFKTLFLPLAVVVAMATGTAAWAQAPTGSTGECKDNTYTSADAKRGACAGHGGVKDWYGAKKGEASAPKSSMGAATKGSMPEADVAKPNAKTTGNKMEAAAGGGAGKVWVNTATHVYHCEGDRWYGKTKKGEYLSEAEAKAKNAHADHGKACT